MPFDIPESVRAVLAKSPYSHLVTLNADGSPQVSLVNPILRGNEILIAHLAEHQKVRNIRRDGRVSLSIEPGTSRDGWREYVVLHGKARITEGGAADVVNEAVRAATGDSGAVFTDAGPEAGFVTHIEVEKVVGVGPWGGSH
ncbi:MAG: PPOX class F420-dependent oxidoreductase [Segniliparus sp.]|uniref:PPOX class F420-dependent oxidoreductase n=1 Tax=Segniliparus sp. TaxID=2804064 RepID=UPI003F3578E8